VVVELHEVNPTEAVPPEAEETIRAKATPVADLRKGVETEVAFEVIEEGFVVMEVVVEAVSRWHFDLDKKKKAKRKVSICKGFSTI